MKNGEGLILKMNATQTIRNQKPLAQWHIPEDLNPPQHHYDNISIVKVVFFLNVFHPDVL